MLMKGPKFLIPPSSHLHGGEGECLPVPHDLPGCPGLEEGGDHLLPPVDVVAHPIVVETCLGEAVGPDCLYGPPQDPIHRRSFGLKGA